MNTPLKFECENECINRILSQVLPVKTDKTPCKGGLQFLINDNGTAMYAIEDDVFYSSARIMSVISEIEAAGGKMLVFPEDAPAMIEKIAEKYSLNAVRVYECGRKESNVTPEQFTDCLWAFDALFMCVKLLEIMHKSSMTLKELCEIQNDFALRKNILEFHCDAGEIRRMIIQSGAEKKHDDDIYFVFETRKGTARIRQLGNENRIRVLVEAADMETAKEISVDIASKFSRSDIDIFDKK